MKNVKDRLLHFGSGSKYKTYQIFKLFKHNYDIFLLAWQRKKASFFQVKYTSYPELAKEERRKKFETNCLEGYTEIVSTAYVQ